MSVASFLDSLAYKIPGKPNYQTRRTSVGDYFSGLVGQEWGLFGPDSSTGRPGSFGGPTRGYFGGIGSLLGSAISGRSPASHYALDVRRLTGGFPEGRYSLRDPRGLEWLGDEEHGAKALPFMYGGLLAEAARPGGVLSDLSTQRAYTGDVQSILAQERLRASEARRGLSQAGLTASSAAAVYAEDPLRSQRQIGGVRSARERQRQEDIFGAEQALADLIASREQQDFLNEFAQEQLRVQQSEASKNRHASFVNTVLGSLL